MHPPAQQPLSCHGVCVNVHICKSHKQWHISSLLHPHFLCCGGGFTFVIESLPFALFLLLFIIQLCAFFSTASIHLFCFHTVTHTHTKGGSWLRWYWLLETALFPSLYTISSNFSFLQLIECTRFCLITYAHAFPIAHIRRTLLFGHSPQWYTR